MMAARPLKRRDELPEDLSKAEFSGAPRERICHWIEDRLGVDDPEGKATAPRLHVHQN